jgi:AbrB family looped-hinge helix DNA binding protein
MRKLVKPLRHGQITIPKEFRDALGLTEDDLLSVTLENGKLEIKPVRVGDQRGNPYWAKELYELLEPVRDSLKDVPEEEINRVIDEAVEEVRARHR